VRASVIDFRHRHNDSQANEHGEPPRYTVHLTPNWIIRKDMGTQVLSSMQ
jgi:hypothetical protein